METEELPPMAEHPGKAELPAGFAEVIRWLRSQESSGWRARYCPQLRSIRLEEGFAQLKYPYDGDEPNRGWDEQQYMEFGDNARWDRYLMQHFGVITSDIPPEGAPLLKETP